MKNSIAIRVTSPHSENCSFLKQNNKPRLFFSTYEENLELRDSIGRKNQGSHIWSKVIYNDSQCSFCALIKISDIENYVEELT